MSAHPTPRSDFTIGPFDAPLGAEVIGLDTGTPLSDDDMRALGVYFSQQKPKGLGAKDPALVKSGGKVWRGGDAQSDVPACVACHSPTGVGIPKNYPRLAGQYDDYLYAELKAFKSGERGANAKDANGQIMATIAGNMTDAQMKAVADYAMGLR